jgi:P pilus assembly chaperone PapD
VENPSPFHVTLAEVHAVTGSRKAVEDKGAMVAPKQSLEFTAPAGTDQVRFITINDYGGRVEHNGPPRQHRGLNAPRRPPACASATAACAN